MLGVFKDGGADANEIIQWMDTETVGSSVSVGEWPVLQTLNMYDGVTLFIPTIPTNLDAGLVYYFYWYEDEAALDQNRPSEIWWFAENLLHSLKPYHTRHATQNLTYQMIMMAQSSSETRIGQ